MSSAILPHSAGSAGSIRLRRSSERALVHGLDQGFMHPRPDLAIETALTLRLVFNLPFRQAEGFLLMPVDPTAEREEKKLKWESRGRHRTRVRCGW